MSFSRLRTFSWLLLYSTIAGCSPEAGHEHGERHHFTVTQKLEGIFSQAAAFACAANTRIQHRQYQQALNDIQTALMLMPEQSEYRFLHCLLKERLGGPLPQAKACYAQLVKQLSQDGDAPCETNMNCVVADLIAEGAQAETRKEHFLNLPASEVESEMRHYLLDDFARDEYLSTVLP